MWKSTSLTRLGKAKQEVTTLKKDEIEKPVGKTEKKEKDEKKWSKLKNTSVRSPRSDRSKERHFIFYKLHLFHFQRI